MSIENKKDRREKKDFFFNNLEKLISLLALYSFCVCCSKMQLDAVEKLKLALS
jgi:hypothetical protein